MIRTVLQVVLLPDRTRVLAQLLGRYKRYGYAAILLYGIIVAVIGATQYVKHDSPDALWVVFFFLIVGTFVLMIRSPLDAWRLAIVAHGIQLWLIDYAVMAPWQWAAFTPTLLGVALFYSRGVIFVVTVISFFALAFSSGVDGGSLGLLPVLALLGYLLGARGRAEQRLEEEKAERAALVERARIAREMHDIVAHHMSNVVVRCETVPYRIEGLSDQAKEEFASVGASARSAITDLQRLLGVLRAAGQSAELEPQPGIAQLTELVRGVSAEIDVDGLPDAVGLTVYRVVQEALTNAARHAPGSGVSVRVHRQDGAVHVDVRNTAGGPSRGGGGGHGLAGMRERVAVHGGTLTAESTEDGGFVLRATIPLGA